MDGFSCGGGVFRMEMDVGMKRDRWLQVRVSEEELRKLDVIGGETGRNRSEVVRWLIWMRYGHNKVGVADNPFEVGIVKDERSSA